MQSLKTPERLLELSKRLSKVADDFEVIDTYMWTYNAKRKDKDMRVPGLFDIIS